MRPETMETCAVAMIAVVAFASGAMGWFARGRVERGIRADYRSLFAACQRAVCTSGTEQTPAREGAGRPATSPPSAQTESLPTPVSRQAPEAAPTEEDFDNAMTKQRDARAVLADMRAQAPSARAPEPPRDDVEDEVGDEEDEVELVADDAICEVLSPDEEGEPLRVRASPQRTKTIDVRALRSAIESMRGRDAARQ